MVALDEHFPARTPVPGARVLDYGCGAGAWLNAFQYCGWQTFGIEASTDVAFLRHARLMAIPSEPDQFDLVIAYQVLQRLPRPLDTLCALSRTLRPGGHCLISVPRLDALAIHRDVAACLSPHRHVGAFTEACLRGLLARAGLETVATLHQLDTVLTQGSPLRLRVLARKASHPAAGPDPVAALQPVLEALSTIDIADPRAAKPTAPAPTACPACSGVNVAIIEQWRLPNQGRGVAGCGDCGLVFVHPPPSSEELDAFYAPDGYGQWKASRLTGQAWKNRPTERRSGSRLRTPEIFTELDRFFPVTAPPAGARVLDFGCGPGTWLDKFQDHGWDTYGLEPSTDAAFTRHARLDAVPIEADFDLVFLYHVLEHLPRPLDPLRELARALRPGGYCFVSVPRIDTLAIHRQPKYCLCLPHHIVGFTEACLRGLLARAGLEVVASFHDRGSSMKEGVPTKLQLLARKPSTPPPVEPVPASALQAVVDAFVALNR